jgi:hypothetical protein
MENVYLDFISSMIQIVSPIQEPVKKNITGNS